jgi:hypothetical protein
VCVLFSTDYEVKAACRAAAPQVLFLGTGVWSFTGCVHMCRLSWMPVCSPGARALVVPGTSVVTKCGRSVNCKYHCYRRKIN